MTIINKVDNDTLQAFGCEQWIEQFVENVINQARLNCNEVTIIDIDGKTIHLSIDGKEYNLRTWNFHPVKRDQYNKVCAEMVDYTLYEMIKDETGGHGIEVCNGMVRINWKN